MKLVHHFEDINNIYLILDLCPHQSLHDLVQRRPGGLTEVEVRYFMKQMVDAVDYMMRKNVLHRDLKVGNTFIDEQMRLKIGDFGLAIELSNPRERRHSFLGTPNYMAPEVCMNKDRIDALKAGKTTNIPPYSNYSFPVDWWALGVMMYNLLYGKSPFPHGNTKENYDNIRAAHVRFPSRRSDVSAEAKNLVRLILNPVAEQRPSPQEILAHPFFTRPSDGIPMHVIPHSLPKTILQCPLNNEFIKHLRKIADNKSVAATEDQNSFAVDYIPRALMPQSNTVKYNDTTSNFLRVNLWLAWDNYGVGYQLSNQSIGQLNLDKTTLFYSPCFTKVLYNKLP